MKDGFRGFFWLCCGGFVSFFWCFLNYCFKIGVSISEDNLEWESRYLRSDGTFFT